MFRSLRERRQHHTTSGFIGGLRFDMHTPCMSSVRESKPLVRISLYIVRASEPSCAPSSRFSIVNARGGSVSQDIEFLEVEEARKLLFASTMKDDRQLKDNIRHHEFPLDLFNIQPSLLTNVLYGENGSGNNLPETHARRWRFIQSVFNIDRKRGFASDEDSSTGTKVAFRKPIRTR